MAVVKDLTGQTFGKLTVVSRGTSYPRNGSAGWICRCECGNERLIPRQHLINGSYQSCGCQVPGAQPRTLASRYRTHYNNARTRGIENHLTIEQYDELTSQNCHYCGGKYGYHNGVDRVDSALGYIPGNYVPCCWVCNSAKRNADPARFREQMREWVKTAYIAFTAESE